MASYLQAFLAFALVCTGSRWLGLHLVNLLRTPLITIYMFAGVAAGPHLLKLMDQDGVDKLDPIAEACIGYIAFSAGAEMYLPMIRPLKSAIFKITLCQALLVVAVGAAVVYAMEPLYDFTDDFDSNHLLSVALLTAVVMSANSPSSAIAIITEMRAKGPFTQTALGVTVIRDVVVILLFAFADEYAASAFLGSLNSLFILELLGQLAASVVLGLVLSYVLRLVLWMDFSWPVKLLNRYRKTPGRVYDMTFVHYFHGYTVVAIGYGIFALSHMLEDHHFELETLLTCMISTFHLINSSAVYRHLLEEAFSKVQDVVYVAFFTDVGITMNVSILPDVMGVAVLLFLVRILVTFLGSYVGGVWAHSRPQHNKYSWMTYLTQAGVALALIGEVEHRFGGDDNSPSGHDWTENYATAVVAAIILAQVAGPIFFKFAINSVGEANKRPAHAGDEGLLGPQPPSQLAVMRTKAKEAFRTRSFSTSAIEHVIRRRRQSGPVLLRNLLLEYIDVDENIRPSSRGVLSPRSSIPTLTPVTSATELVAPSQYTGEPLELAEGKAAPLHVNAPGLTPTPTSTAAQSPRRQAPPLSPQGTGTGAGAGAGASEGGSSHGDIGVIFPDDASRASTPSSAILPTHGRSTSQVCILRAAEEAMAAVRDPTRSIGRAARTHRPSIHFGNDIQVDVNRSDTHIV